MPNFVEAGNLQPNKYVLSVYLANSHGVKLASALASASSTFQAVRSSSASFVPSYDWQRVESWHDLPDGLEHAEQQQPDAGGGSSQPSQPVARIPRCWRLQLWTGQDTGFLRCRLCSDDSVAAVTARAQQTLSVKTGHPVTLHFLRSTHDESGQLVEAALPLGATVRSVAWFNTRQSIVARTSVATPSTSAAAAVNCRARAPCAGFDAQLAACLDRAAGQPVPLHSCGEVYRRHVSCLRHCITQQEPPLLHQPQQSQQQPGQQQQQQAEGEEEGMEMTLTRQQIARLRLTAPSASTVSSYTTRSIPARTHFGRCQWCAIDNPPSPSTSPSPRPPPSAPLPLVNHSIQVTSFNAPPPHGWTDNWNHTSAAAPPVLIGQCRHSPYFRSLETTYLRATPAPFDLSSCDRLVRGRAWLVSVWNLRNVFHLTMDLLLPLFDTMMRTYGSVARNRTTLFLHIGLSHQTPHLHSMLRHAGDDDHPMRALRMLSARRVHSRALLHSLPGRTCFEDLHLGVDFSYNPVWYAMQFPPEQHLMNASSSGAKMISRRLRRFSRALVEFVTKDATTSSAAAPSQPPVAVLFLRRSHSRRLSNLAALLTVARQVVAEHAAAATATATPLPAAAPAAAPSAVRVVGMEHLSFSYQVRLLQRTDVLVATHGQGAANLLWMRPGSALLLIMPPRWYGWKWTYGNMALAQGLHLLTYRRDGETFWEGWDGTDTDYNDASHLRDVDMGVPPPRMRALLATALALVARSRAAHANGTSLTPQFVQG